MSPVYYVASGHETPGEPTVGWYFGPEEEPHGPYFTFLGARNAWDKWNKLEEAE